MAGSKLTQKHSVLSLTITTNHSVSNEFFAHCSYSVVLYMCRGILRSPQNMASLALLSDSKQVVYWCYSL